MDFELFDHVASVYANANANASDGAVSNAALYRTSARLAGIPDEAMDRLDPVGKALQPHSLKKRAVRWHQQTLKKLGLLEHVDRGIWRLTEVGKQKLCRIQPAVAVLGYSTDLGICIWGEAEHVFSRLDRPVSLLLTSPPFRLRKPRAYGNPAGEQEYVDFVLRIVEPVINKLLPGGSVLLNVSNDVFEVGSPARSMYIERLLIALHDRLGLKLMERFVWENPSKPPGPVVWASKKRVHLNVGYEPIYWLTNDPSSVRTNNRRVLQPHTEDHLRFLQNGGVKKDASFCDGAYTHRVGKSFANQTEGKIPRNILKFSHNCSNKQETAKVARTLGLPVHGATFPLKMAKFLVQFFTGDGEDEFVVDTCAGWNTTGLACEELGIPWMATEVMRGYVLASALRFREAVGFSQARLADC